METKDQSQQSKYLNAEGKTGIVTNFEHKALWKGIFQLKCTQGSGRKIDEIAKAYCNAQDLVIRCKHCGEYFCPCDDTLDLIQEGYITSDSCNICDDCWDMLQISESDYSETFSDADPGL